MLNSKDSPIGKDSAQWYAQLLFQMATSSSNNLPGVSANNTNGGGVLNAAIGGGVSQTGPPLTTYAGPNYAGLLPIYHFTKLLKHYQSKTFLPDWKMLQYWDTGMIPLN